MEVRIRRWNLKGLINKTFSSFSETEILMRF